MWEAIIDQMKEWVLGKNYLTTSYVDRGDPAAHDFALGDFTTDNNWHELDLSTIVPAGAKAIVASTYLKNNAVNKTFAARRHGNVNVQGQAASNTQVANLYIFDCLVVAVDDNRKIDYRITAVGWTAIDMTIRGWWL